MPKAILATAIFALALALPAIAGAASPYAAIDAAQGQLSKNVVPSLYVIDLAPNPKSNTIAGHERITLTVRKPSKTIVLNALQTKFGRVTLDGVPAKVTVNESKQTVTFSFPKRVAPGTHVLDIRYVATLQHSAQGLFKQNYADSQGKPVYMYGTQLEATDARRVFPSVDEPAFKARFRLSAVVPKAWTAVSNTPVVSVTAAGPGTKRVSFATTPPMSTYLLVLTAGDFVSVHAVSDGIRLGVYATRGKKSEEAYALEVMEQLMPYYDSYYGVKFPMPKLDTIAIPGGFLGAMENWGGITYNESTILFDPKLQPASDERETFGIIAHEESHQWNGDLTTMPWWDELWLNEGFATWMQTKAPDHFHPEWQMWLGADGDVDNAMSTDDLPTTHAVYEPVHNDTEIDAVFDEISYTKAGAVLRMLESYLGPAEFQRALQRYFRTHQYTVGNAADLWKALSAVSGQDIAAIAHNWIYEPGFPLVTATASCAAGKRTIALAQQRYLFDRSADPGSTLWQIPLNLQLDARSATTTPVLFKDKTQTIDGGSCDAPLIVNGSDVGYYRVAYDPVTQRTQQASFVQLPAADRLGLLNDSWAFVESGRAKIGEYLAYVESDGKDTDPHIIGPILAKLGNLLRYEQDKPGEAALKAYVAARVRPLVAQFGGWDGTGMTDDQLQVRNTALGLLAQCGDRPTIDEAKKRFAELVANPDAFTPLNKTAVLGVAGYAADQTIYMQIVQMAMKATNPTEQQNDFFAMFGANDPTLAMESLNSALQLPPQFAPYAPYIVAAVGQRHPQIGWKFLNDNAGKIFSSMSAFERVSAVSGVAGAFWNGIPTDQIESFLKSHVPPDGAKEIAKAMEEVRANQELQARLLPQIDAYVAAQSKDASK